ncbi:MAG: hypothetical protein WBB17_13370, partial [Saprospiraceae bacterium]
MLTRTLIVLYFLFLITFQGISQQLLEFKYDKIGSADESNFGKYEISSIILNNDYLRIQLYNYDLNSEKYKYETSNSKIECRCLSSNSKENNVLMYKHLTRFNNFTKSSDNYDSYLHRNYYFDNTLLKCKIFDLYMDDFLLFKNLQIDGLKNNDQEPQIKLSENNLNIGLMIDEKTNLSTSTMLLAFLQQFPILDSKNNTLNPKLGSIINKKGYTLTGRHSWNDMKHYFYLYKDNDLIKEFIFEYNISIKYNEIADKKTINTID